MVLAFSGKIGSGKSSVSAAAADALNLPWVSFGDYVRKQAVAKHLESSRQNLQDLGQKLLKADAEGFCQAVLSQAPDWQHGLVVDGIRHVDVLTIIKRLVIPQQLIHIHLALDEPMREARVTSREGVVEESERIRMNNHPTEEQVLELLPSIADVVVSSTGTLDTVVEKVKTSVESLLTHTSATTLSSEQH
ncbi:hypothetical protein GCM10023172_35970 [Hymenobacter ginsengisoli]|uniref:Dephospho-CoA kinase n=1 Tax=Hymenobacter ginsengisoli TaxID=1051626 RepID=A0ABP8QMZ8_9BACT|nr:MULTISPECIES: AAA family ATPase [unclassified Hymenobacter]MBO2033825.1 AAA family ATPase [Hymenobacter sp. BT559]